MVMREQTVAYIALLILGAGIALTGGFPTLTGLLITTFIMSVGFHYFETVNQSLSLQLFPKKDAPRLMGRVAGAAATAQFVAYGGIALLWWGGMQNYQTLFAIIGFACVAVTIAAFLLFPKFDGPVPQRKSIVLRKRYWLYYALTMMNGARGRSSRLSRASCSSRSSATPCRRWRCCCSSPPGSTLSSLRPRRAGRALG